MHLVGWFTYYAGKLNDNLEDARAQSIYMRAFHITCRLLSYALFLFGLIAFTTSITSHPLMVSIIQIQQFYQDIVPTYWALPSSSRCYLIIIAAMSESFSLLLASAAIGCKRDITIAKKIFLFFDFLTVFCSTVLVVSVVSVFCFIILIGSF